MAQDDLSRYTDSNRRAWNEIAAVREKTFPPAEFFAQGGSTLEQCAVTAARSIYGNLAGLRLIHLQCATGEDTLSWAGLGTRAAGVDISDAQTALAQAKAQASGLPVDFFASDIYSLPGSLPAGFLGDGFDLVFTGGGAIVWLPDLPRWAQVVAALLMPGGRLLLVDEHPLSGCIAVENGVLRLVDDYFRRDQPWEGAGWTHFSGADFARENKYEFNWPLGDIVTALARAGLLIERLEEFPGLAEWRYTVSADNGDSGAREQAGHLPGRYLLVARKSQGDHAR
jgi:SAM-dependent methyltransferase